jgi:hypothetical protein
MSENIGRRFIEFLRVFALSDSISKGEVMQVMNMKESAFYKYLAICRKVVKIKYVGSIGGNAYYSLDKDSLRKYFEL